MTTKVYEQFEVFLVILFSLLAKWLLTEEPPNEDESVLSRKLRQRRAYGGVVAGALVAFYGHEPLINAFEVFTPDMKPLLLIVLTITGEHFIRALITKLPHWIELYVQKRVK